MLNAFEDYMENKTPSNLPKAGLQVSDGSSTTPMSSAFFSYKCIIEICEQELRESREEGEKYFDNLIIFLIRVYADLDSKEKSISEQSLEVNVRYWQLRAFIKTHIFDDFLILYNVRIGTDRLIDVDRCSIR